MLALWGMRSTPSLPSLPGPLWSGVVAPDRALSIGEIELNCVLMLNWFVWFRTVWLTWIAWNRNVFGQLNCGLELNWIVWNRTDYLYKMYWALNNLQRLICYKNQPTNHRFCFISIENKCSMYVPVIKEWMVRWNWKIPRKTSSLII